MLAQHLHDEPTFRLVWWILNVHIAALHHAFAATTFICSPFEHRLQSLRSNINSFA